MLLRLTTGFIVSAVLFAQTTPQGDTQGYEGPSILSRGMLPSVAGRSENLRFRPYISVNAQCDNGLTAVSVDAQGRVPNVGLCGVEASAGIYGYHRWKTTTVGLRYSGSYTHYTHANYYDGTSQNLALGITHRLSKRATVTLREQAGVYYRKYDYFSAPGVVNTASLTRPGPQLFDNEVRYGSTGVDLVVRLSARWSFDMGSEAYVTRYRSSALIGSTGIGGRANMAYRYSRHGTLGGVYSFTHFSFTHSFGASDVHVMGVLASSRLSRSWEFQSLIGVARVETLALKVIQVDPVIAAITGQTSSVGAAYFLNYSSQYDLSLTRGFRRGSLNFGVARTVIPGDGVYLTSSQDAATVSYSYTGVRHWNFGASGGYNRMKALIQDLRPYTGFGAGIGVTRDLGKGLQFVLRLDERHYNNGTSYLRRDSYRASLGFAWSPGDVPLSLW